MSIIFKYNRYIWNSNFRYWVNFNKISFDKQYYYNLHFFSNTYAFPKVNFLKFRTKIISLRRSNIFLKYGIIYRWNKTLFFNRMALFFIVAKRRMGFLKLWNLGLSKNLVIKYPFLAFKQNFSRKFFFSLKSFFFKSFFFRYLPYFFFRIMFVLINFFLKMLLFLGNIFLIFSIFKRPLCFWFFFKFYEKK